MTQNIEILRNGKVVDIYRPSKENLSKAYELALKRIKSEEWLDGDKGKFRVRIVTDDVR